jgi:beta-propeller repeat-containing protein/centrosomal CEP192-like protein
MKMRTWLQLFLLLLLIAVMPAPSYRPTARGHGGAWHVGQSAYPQADSRPPSLDHSVASPAKMVQPYGKLPLRFDANQGQTDPQVKFLSRGSGYTLFLTSTEAVLALREPPRTPPFVQKHVENVAGNRVTSAAVLRMKIDGASPAARAQGLELLPGRNNYFIGNDPAKWRTNVPTYAKVRYEAIYPGVDLVYYGNQGQLEYDFVVAPGTNPRSIRLVIVGTERLETNARGDLVMDTGGGEVRLQKPLVYQESGNVRKEIVGRYVLRGKHQISFDVATFDASKPLIIDPVLSYSTYLGGRAGDAGNAIALDFSGNAYVTGFTNSADFPSKSPLQATLGGSSDVFVTKLDASGSTLIYSTFLGGNTDDAGNAIAVDSSGNAYVTGSTSSANFPAKNPVQVTLGGSSDAFVAKLDSTGSTLMYSTFLGGGGSDSGNAIAVDSSDNAYVTGLTNSVTFPTKNPLQATLGGSSDAFVTKLDASGSTLIYSTFLGGNTDDAGNAIAVDSSNNAYVTGATSSANFPTKSPLQAASGGGVDVFVTKLDATGSTLIYSTFLGGSADDAGDAIAVDSSGNTYLSGLTRSTNFPTASPFQASCKSCGSNQSNAFVAEVNAAGSALMYSTYLGGSGNGTDGDFGNGITVDASGNAYVTGFTSSPDFPLANPIQATLLPQTCSFDYYGYTYTIPCSNTAFVTKLNPSGSALLYSTYLGASGGDLESGRGIAVDSAGNAYVTGTANSKLLLTPGALQASPGGNGDAFVAKISSNDAAGFSLSAFSLSFQDEGIAGTTPSQQITLANTGSATLNITSIVPSGDFAATTCSSSLAGGAGCVINVTFTPTAAGARTGTITITDSVASSPQKVTLSGNGIAGLAATVSPTSLSFGNQTQGTTSAAQAVTLQNTGSAPLTITGFSFVGTNASAFTLLSASCNQSQSLAVGASCPFNIAFAPLAAGNLSATLQILDNSAQSPRNVPLAGVGLAPPTVALSPTTLNFAAQVVGGKTSGQSVTLTTSGVGTLGISSISASNSDFAASDNCGKSVAGGANCAITVTFTPTATGARAGTLVIVDNAIDTPQMVSLSGLGTDFSVSPATGSQNSATVTAGQPATYTLSAAGSSGFSGTVSFSCSDLAAQSTCTVSPNPLTVNGTTAQSTTVTVTTTARSALPLRWHPPILPPNLRVPLPWLLLLLSLVILSAALRGRSRMRRAWVGLAAMLMGAALFFGCGGGGASTPQNGTLAGTYVITVNATSAGVTRTTTLSLTVR